MFLKGPYADAESPAGVAVGKLQDLVEVDPQGMHLAHWRFSLAGGNGTLLHLSVCLCHQERSSSAPTHVSPTYVPPPQRPRNREVNKPWMKLLQL